MNNHLDDWELSAALASVTLDQQTRDHLGSCIVCRRRLEAFRDTVGEHRRDLAAVAPDLQKQKEAILARLTTAEIATPMKRRARWVRPLLAAAATALLVIAGGLLQHGSDPTVIPTPRPDLPIEEILAQTEALLADDSIPGFEVLGHFSEAEIDSLLAQQNPKL